MRISSHKQQTTQFLYGYQQRRTKGQNKTEHRNKHRVAFSSLQCPIFERAISSLSVILTVTREVEGPFSWHAINRQQDPSFVRMTAPR